MPVVKPGTKEGAYGDVSVYRGIGGFGISVLYRPGRSYRPEASSLTSILLTNAPPANANAVAAVKTANVPRFFTNVALQGAQILPHANNCSFAALLRIREP